MIFCIALSGSRSVGYYMLGGLDKIEYNITNKEVAIAQLSTYRTKWSSSLKSSNHTHHIPMKLALYTIVSILRILSI